MSEKRSEYEFYTVFKEKRPVRLCEATRKFAWESLNHKYGLEAMENYAVKMDGVPGFQQMTDLDKYNACISKICSEAPLRIAEGEKISGSASLGLAIFHQIPATFEGKPVMMSMSHLTIDYKGMLEGGIPSVRNRIEKAKKAIGVERPERMPFLNSCEICLDAFETVYNRYCELLKNTEGYEENYRTLSECVIKPAKSFREAVQCLWFTFAFTRLCGNWPGIGRIDQLLGQYLKNDLNSGAITIDEAREILAHFFIKGCEWIRGGDCGSGDAQHYQNIVLAGIDENENDVTNEVTYLVLDIIEELGISDFPTTVRLGRYTDDAFLRRLAEVMRYGGGILAVYGEETVMKAMRRYGYGEKEVRNFANDGCWEVQIPGHTSFSYLPFDSLGILQNVTLKGYAEDFDYSVFDTYESLYSAYTRDLKAHIDATAAWLKTLCYEDRPMERKPGGPVTVISLFEHPCIEKGLSYSDGGPDYSILSPHIGGFPDTANSLMAIKKLVYDEKRYTLGEFIAILRKNWEGYEPLRQEILNKFPQYGNDDDEVDAIAAKILEDFTGYCFEADGKCAIGMPPGASTFGRQLEWRPGRHASAHGRKEWEILAANSSPTPGSDREGATAIIKSYCKTDLTRMVTGSALDVKLLASNVEGEDGISAIMGILKGFVALGGFFMQPDVTDAEILRDAQKNPENYQTLSVRVSGWNARFVTLCKDWQDMVIEANQ